mgnify:CR=1 FL=1
MSHSLDACVAGILRDPALPTFSSRIQELLAIGAEDHTAQRRARLVLQDYGLTLRILQCANSFQYNRSHKPIDNVARAIVVMGVVELRNQAGALQPFAQFEKRSTPLRNLLLLSMLTALHASAAADAEGVNRQEEAYLLGMLRNLGEVLVACHWPETYAQIGEDPPGTVPGSTALRVLGFSYESLARAVGEHWHLPPQILALWSKTTGDATDIVTALAQFGHDMTTVMYRRSTGDQTSRLRLLRTQHGRRFGLTEDDILDVVDTAVEETQPLFAQLKVTIDDIRIDSTRANPAA